MRQPLKPFSVETRQSGRRKLRPPANAPRDPFLGPDPDGSRSGSYDAALRAADILFGGGSAPQPADTSESSAMDVSLPETSSVSAALRPQGRILRAIEEPVVHETEPAARPAARRGRPPGSKNKVTRVPAPRAVKKHVSNERPDMTADELVASLFGTVDVVEPAFVERAFVERAPTPIAIPSGGARLRFTWITKTLGPGERWKQRLPRVCW